MTMKKLRRITNKEYNDDNISFYHKSLNKDIIIDSKIEVIDG